MLHHAARRAVAFALDGSGFGDHAAAVAAAASLAGDDGCPEVLARAALERACALPPDAVPVVTAIENQAPVPGDQALLCRHLGPLVARDAADVATSLAWLAALTELWPHASSEERPQLRARFLSAMRARCCPSGGRATLDELRLWSRDLPTLAGTDPVDMAQLARLPDASTPREAYQQLAALLAPPIDASAVAWGLAQVAQRQRLRRTDPDGLTLRAFLGAVAVERIAAWAPPELRMTLLAQLGHQLWYAARHGAPITGRFATATEDELPAVVATGDVPGAQRAARLAAKVPTQFCPRVAPLVAAAFDRPAEGWLPTLVTLVAVRWRAGRNPTTPDDAALLATVLAEGALVAV
jgi:hypothetical protein